MSLPPGSPSPAALLAAAREGFAAPAAVATAPDEWEGRVRVRAWRAAAVVGEAEAADADPLVAARLAASAAARARAGAEPEAGEEDLGLHVELATGLEAVAPEGLSGLLLAIAPGRDGLVLRDGDTTVGGWPADALTGDGRSAGWVKQLLRAVRPPGARLAASTQVWRFTTIEAAGPALPPEDEQPPRLVGGIRYVPPEEVTRERLVEAAAHAAAWLVRHQLPNGLFHYEFKPETQSWSTADTIVRQAGCAWALAAVANASPRGGPLLAARAAIEGILTTGLRRDGPGRLFYLVSHDGMPRLGAIPLLLLALAESRRTIRMDREIPEQLTATLLAVQRPDGAFGTTARGLELEGSETYYAGQIALALGRRHAIRRSDRVARSVRRAITHYAAQWDADPEGRDLSFVTWMLQACDVWHALTQDQNAADYAFAMADWALEAHHPEDHPHPLWGGAYQNTPGIGTAAYTEGMVRAYHLARRLGEPEREARYRTALLESARFLLQLPVEAADLAFFGPANQRGAVRAALHRKALRCDNAQHFIMASLQIASMVLGNEPPPEAAAENAETPSEGPLEVEPDSAPEA